MSKMEKLNVAVCAHFLGSSMAHYTIVELRPIISKSENVDINTEFALYDVVKLPVQDTKILVVDGKPCKVPIVDKDNMPKNFPKKSGGWPSGCMWNVGNDQVIEMSHQSGNTVCHCVNSLDVWAVLGPPLPTGKKRCVFVNAPT